MDPLPPKSDFCVQAEEPKPPKPQKRETTIQTEEIATTSKKEMQV